MLIATASDTITALAALVTACGIAYQIVVTARRDVVTRAKVEAVTTTVEAVGSTVEAVGSKVDAVHAEVATANGIALGLLGERTEGRRIETEVPAGDRTDSEQGYVDRLHGPTDAAGDPKPTA